MPGRSRAREEAAIKQLPVGSHGENTRTNSLLLPHLSEGPCCDGLTLLKQKVQIPQLATALSHLCPLMHVLMTSQFGRDLGGPSR